MPYRSHSLTSCFSQKRLNVWPSVSFPKGDSYEWSWHYTCQVYMYMNVMAVSSHSHLANSWLRLYAYVWHVSDLGRANSMKSNCFEKPLPLSCDHSWKLYKQSSLPRAICFQNFLVSASPASILCISLFEDHVNVFPRRFLQSIALSGSQISSKHTWSKPFVILVMPLEKMVLDCQYTTIFYTVMVYVNSIVGHSEANCRKTGIFVN